MYKVALNGKPYSFIFSRQRGNMFVCVRTMQVQYSLSDSQRLSSINRKLRWAQVSVKCDDGLVLEWRPLLADLEASAVHDQDVFRLQLDVRFIEHQRPAWKKETSIYKIIITCIIIYLLARKRNACLCPRKQQRLQWCYKLCTQEIINKLYLTSYKLFQMEWKKRKK